MSQNAFISAIMERPALWQSKHPYYKEKKNNVKLWGEIKELFPQNEVSELKKKWKNLKDSYRKEVKKNPSSRSGDSEIQWKYFEKLSFLRDEIIVTLGDSTLVETETLHAEDEGDAEADGSIIDVDKVENIASPVSDQFPPSPQNPQHKPSKKRQTPNELRAEYLEIEKRKLQLLEKEILQKEGPSSVKSDDYHFLMSILTEMEKLRPIQKLRLRNTINQALMDEINISLYNEPLDRRNSAEY